MFTLSDASRETKLILKWGGIILLTLISLFILFRVAIFIKEILLPTPPPKPTLAFGKLEAQIFPGSVIDDKFTYSINTISGTLPSLADQTKVYRILQNPPDLLALNKAQDKINNVGFGGNPRPVSDRIFEWSHDPNAQGIPRTIRFNILNDTFTIDSGFMENESIISGNNLPNEEEAINLVRQTLSSMTLQPPDLDLEKSKTHLFKIEGNALTSSTSLSNSQVIEVDLFQKDINKLPIFYERLNESNMSFLVAGGNLQPQVVGGTYIYQKISQEAATYPLKTTDEAFKELEEGKAYISSYFGSKKDIAVKNVLLAYYIGSNPQDYLMPVIVFTGNDGFAAYIPAVRDEWISK